eukprot:1157226-Pelagomonas_calceolata.AAC.5
MPMHNRPYTRSWKRAHRSSECWSSCWSPRAHKRSTARRRQRQSWVGRVQRWRAWRPWLRSILLAWLLRVKGYGFTRVCKQIPKKLAAQQEAARLRAMAMPDALWSLLQQLEAEVAAANTRAGRDSSRSSQSDLASLDQGLLASAAKTPTSGVSGSGAGARALGMLGSTPKAPSISGGGVGGGMGGGLLLEGPLPGHAVLSSVGGGGGGTRAAELVVHQAVLVLRRLREQNRKMAKVEANVKPMSVQQNECVTKYE